MADPATSGESGEAAVVVPFADLSAEALQGVVEAFVLREGTDYGERELLLERKVADVIRQLHRGEAQILFDPVSQSVNIVAADRAAGPPQHERSR